MHNSTYIKLVNVKLVEVYSKISIHKTMKTVTFQIDAHWEQNRNSNRQSTLIKL